MTLFISVSLNSITSAFEINDEEPAILKKFLVAPIKLVLSAITSIGESSIDFLSNDTYMKSSLLAL